jgi:hypothetical protein
MMSHLNGHLNDLQQLQFLMHCQVIITIIQVPLKGREERARA